MKYGFLFILLTIFQSCGHREKVKNEVYTINPEKFSNEQFTLSDIAENIHYVPLDNTCTIGLIYSLRINDKGLYISTKNIGIVQFTEQGKFVRNLAKKGEGPDEYYYGMDFTIDEENGNVYVVDKNKIRIYSPNGAFLRDISTDAYIESAAGGIEILNSCLFLPDYGTSGDLKYNWIILDTLGNLILNKKNIVQLTGQVLKGGMYKNGGKLFYFNYLNDSIFSIYPNFKDSLAYLFSNGDHRWPKEGLELTKISQLTPFFRLGNMFETKKFIFMEYGYHNKSAFLLIDKKTKKTFQGFKEENVGLVNFVPYIINDVDGGIPISLGNINLYYFVKNDIEYVASFMHPFELKAHVTSETFKKSTPKYPEKKKELEKLANSLDENDNPVLMLVKLKE